MKKIVVSGKTVDDAVKAGIAQLKTKEDRVKVVVLEQPSKGLFGLIGTKDAKVELELIPDALEEAELFLQNVFRTMDLEVTIEQQVIKDGILLNMNGSDLGMLIGRRGQTLDALQYLANIVANRYSSSHVRITLDAERFRERRRKTLEDLAVRLAERVIRSKKEVVLEPMSSQERKVIHARLQDHSRVKTYSKGEEPNRRVVIVLK
ncbi:RNA-binding cell elongation regulator Jag/EloR [Paenibacillus thalictri]|uniref:RNA-binding protein KhpB n=1 Tax=Paenibacillus thalictri TaxID=2527873 RepID=A0A4Q9DQD8_9BACL|nr:RNA-binding cell elongation regulator Jag/EloR [Paenibacillus thalictri]TBL77466.1 protein jag [Paenibacillus thalictri]